MEAPQWWIQLFDLLRQLWQLLTPLFAFLLQLLPGGLWLAFWLWAVDWRKLWPNLAAGAWAPCVLLVVMAAAVWSRVAPSECDCLGFVRLPNFWWQLGSCSALAATALFGGWLQGYMGWEPPEYSVEPPEPGHGPEHGHAHH